MELQAGPGRAQEFRPVQTSIVHALPLRLLEYDIYFPGYGRPIE